MRCIEDKKSWKIWYGKIKKRRTCATPDEASRTVGCCVKTREMGQDGFPKEHGIIAHYDEPSDEVVLVSHPDRPLILKRPLCVWQGTVENYRALWEAD